MTITVELTEAEARVIKEILEIADFDAIGFCDEEIQSATSGSAKVVSAIEEEISG